jgi:hypothetical protein
MAPNHKKSEYFANVAPRAVMDSSLKLESSNTWLFSLCVTHTANPMSANFI